MGRTYIKDLRRGDTVSGVFLVEGANFKQTRNGKFFIQMTLRDFSAAVKALRWEANVDEFREIERHPFLHVDGRVEEFQGAPQIIVDEYATLSADDAQANPSDFLPRSRRPSDEMARELEDVVRSVEDPDLRRLIQAILDRPGVQEGLCDAPAGKVMHHAYVGGLLEHILSLAALADRVQEHYPWLDRSMLLAGVILHDLGKITELTYRTGFGYSDEGQLLGHITIVIGWIDEAVQSLGDLDPEKALELKHIVSSHHGKLEYGSPKIPMTGEALALHFIDNLDAKLSAYRQSFQDAALTSDRWGDFNPMLGTRLYFPRRLDQGLATDGDPRRHEMREESPEPRKKGDGGKQRELFE